jgi:hypothetical protein
MRWANCVVRIGEIRNKCNILVGRPQGKRPLGRPTCKLEGNIRIDLKEIGWKGADWVHLSHDKDQWRAVVNTVKNLPIP